MYTCVPSCFPRIDLCLCLDFIFSNNLPFSLSRPMMLTEYLIFVLMLHSASSSCAGPSINN